MRLSCSCTLGAGRLAVLLKQNKLFCVLSVFCSPVARVSSGGARKYARWLRPDRHVAGCFPVHTYMTTYNYLLNKKSSGELSILFRLGLPTQFTQWMDICEFHLMYPNLSQLKVALHFRVSAKTVWRAYKILESTI